MLKLQWQNWLMQQMSVNATKIRKCDKKLDTFFYRCKKNQYKFTDFTAFWLILPTFYGFLHIHLYLYTNLYWNLPTFTTVSHKNMLPITNFTALPEFFKPILHSATILSRYNKIKIELIVDVWSICQEIDEDNCSHRRQHRRRRRRPLSQTL